MANRRRSRKQVYVSRAIQGRLLVRLGAYFIAYHLFLWHILFVTQELPFGGSASFTERYAAFFEQHAILLVFMAAVLPILLWDVLKFSHRIAGPFVRFEQALRQMASGETIEPISLRKGDLVLEFLDVFNEFVAAHNCQLSSAPRSRNASGQPTSGKLPDASATPSCDDQSEMDRSYARS